MGTHHPTTHRRKVVSAFTFTTRLGGASPRDPRNSENSGGHYTLFPFTLGLGQILREYSVTELRLSLNAGRPNYDRWGHPEHPCVSTRAAQRAWMAGGDPLS